MEGNNDTTRTSGTWPEHCSCGSGTSAPQGWSNAARGQEPGAAAIRGGRSMIVDTLYPALIRILTGLLIVVLCAWMLVGGINMVLALGNAFGGGWASAAEHTIINALILLALLEVIRTLQAYLRLGRVRVTFILDTALVVLISELMGLWFREYAPEKVLLGLGVIVALVALRIVTARFSPEQHAAESTPAR